MGARQLLQRDSGRTGKRAWRLLILGLAVGLGLANLVTGLGPAWAIPIFPEATTVTLEPSSATLQGCETILVEIRINDVIDLYGADVRLSFDPAVLEVVDTDPGLAGVQIEPSDDLLQPGYTINVADNTAGTILYAVTQFNPAEPVDGSGVLAVIHLRARSVAASSALLFTYTKLADRDANEIPASASDGTVATVAPAAATLSIARLDSTTARLTWTAVPDTDAYSLYRDTAPYFTPVEPPYQSTTALVYDDVGALGDVNTQHYYQLQAVCANGFHGTASNRVGEYDYVLANAAASNYSDIAIVFDNPAYVDAASLASYIGTFVQRIMRYNPATQTFQTYIVGRPATNFPLALGDFVFVLTNNTAPASTALVGGVPDPGEVWFSLVSGSPVQYNFLSMPLDRPLLTSASAVAVDVGSGVYRVMRYRTDTQSYQTYIPGRPATDFPLVIGEPFVLQLSTGAPSRWPAAR